MYDSLYYIYIYYILTETNVRDQDRLSICKTKVFKIEKSFYE